MYYVYTFIAGAICGAGALYGYRGYLAHKLAAVKSAAKAGVNSAAQAIDKKL